MNLLIVDDNPKRYGDLVQKLRCDLFKSGKIHLSSSVEDALEKLAATKYDVLIVDILLPETDFGSECPDGGLQLMQHIQEDDTLIKPTYIVGITSASDEVEGLTAMFDSGPWVLLRDYPGAPDWGIRLEKLLSHAFSVEKAEAGNDYKSDVCIIAALKSPEYDAVARQIVNLSDPELVDSATYVQRGTLKSGDTDLSVVIAYCSRMGATESALLASRLVNVFRPRLLAMAGICAGYEEKAQFGDVIVGSPVWDYSQSSKITIDETGAKIVQYAPDYINVDSDVSSHFLQLADDTEFLVKVHKDWPAEKPYGPPRVHVKPSATGPAVIADGKTLKDLRQNQHRDTYGLEMEAYGVYCAARSAARPRPFVFSAKSVCDYGNYLKNDKYQSYAAYCSAALVVKFIQKYGENLIRAEN